MTRIDRIKLDMAESHTILEFYKKLQQYFDINLALDTQDGEPSNYHTSSRLEQLNFHYYNFIQEVIKTCNEIPEENYCYCKECNPIEGTPIQGEEYEVDYQDMYEKIKEGYKIPIAECKRCIITKDNPNSHIPDIVLCEDHHDNRDYFKPKSLDIAQ